MNGAKRLIEYRCHWVGAMRLFNYGSRRSLLASVTEQAEATLGQSGCLPGGGKGSSALLSVFCVSFS